MKSILIYTEGGHYLGLGNVYRMIELSASLKKTNQDIQIMFITSSGEYVQHLIKEKRYNLIHCNKSKVLDTIINLTFDILIIDKLNLKNSFLSEIRKAKKQNIKIVLFGNLTSANNFADLVINAMIGSDFENKDYYIGKTHYLVGPKYLTLREEFKHNSYVYKNNLKKILLLFGGSDQANYSYKVTRDIYEISNEKYTLTVITGPGYQNNEILNKFISDKYNIHHFSNVNNISYFINNNDFMVTSPGTSMFEGFYTGIPTIGLFQNESQKKIFRDFFMTIDYKKIDNIVDYIQSIYYNYQKYQLELKKYEVGLGKKEIINKITEMI